MQRQTPPFNSVDKDKAQAVVSKVPHWHHKFEVFPGVVTPGTYDPEFLLPKLRLPEDMTGLRVLDIGPSDGFFSMKMALRGAQVTAIDYREKDAHGFGAMEYITGLSFDYRQLNLYDIPYENIGEFDLVLLLGVIYHLPDMIRALEIVARLCRSRLIVESQYEPDLMPGVAVARYYEANTLSNDITNFWVPNKECLYAMLRDTGFKINRDERWGQRLLADASIDAQAPGRKMKLAYGLIPT